MSVHYSIVCVDCGKIFTENETITRCLTCGGALDIRFDMKRLKGSLNEYVLKNTPIAAMKYLNFYPLLDRTKIVSLNEGATPLVSALKLGEKYGVKNLYIKNEGANPTGVFKDRGTMVEISKALELGAKAVVVASTGNMAASVSAYCAKAEIPCYVVVPENTPMGKLSQSLAYGGKVLKIRGNYGDCVRLSEEMSKKFGFLLAGDYAFRSEGQKSIAFEIIEQLNWNVPDVVIVPVGCGTNLYGIAKGFYEFFETGVIGKIPRFIAVQPEGTDTMTTAFYANEKKARQKQNPVSLCGAVNIGTPLDDVKVMEIVKRSGGDFEMIDDQTVLIAQKNMATLASVFTEPSGALPVACLEKMLKNGKISEDETVVCVATGIGLKDSHSATLLFSDLPSLNADIEEIKNFLDSGISGMKSQKSNGSIIFSTCPLPSKIAEVLETDWNIDLEKNPELLTMVEYDVHRFFERKNEMKKNEFQGIVEDALSDLHSTRNSFLKIIDFSAENGLLKPAKATAKIQFFEENLEGAAVGTGPVDAVFSAIENALLAKTNFKIFLKDYSVHIPDGGRDAMVIVKIVFANKDGKEATVKGVSTDVVVASVSAFQKGFVRLFA